MKTMICRSCTKETIVPNGGREICLKCGGKLIDKNDTRGIKKKWRK